MVYQRIFDKNQVNILEKEINNLLSIGFIKQVAFDEQAKKKNMCVYCHMSKKSRVGRSGLLYIYIFLLLLLSAKPEIVVPESDSGVLFSKFPVK